MATVALVIAVIAVAVVGGLLRLHLDTTVRSVSAQDRSVQLWTQEQNSFGGDPIAVLLTSQQRDQLLYGQPAVNLLGLEGKLASLPNVAVVYGPATTLNEIALSVKKFVNDVYSAAQTARSQAVSAAEAAGQSADQAQAAGQAALVQYEVRYGTLLTTGLKIGLPSLTNPQFGPSVFLPGGKSRTAFHWLVPDATHAAILVRPAPNLDQRATGRLLAAIRTDVKGAGLPLSSSAVTGQPVIAASLGTEIVDELPLLSAVVVAVVLLTFLLTRRHTRWWERVLPLGIGLLATAVTMAIFGWAGVPLSLGLLAFLPIILGVGTDYPIYALRAGKTRVILAAVLASGVSLAVLVASPLPFVRDLGLALVTGLVLSAVLGLAAARLLGLPRPERTPAPVDAAQRGHPWTRWATGISRYRRRWAARLADRRDHRPGRPGGRRRRWVVFGVVGLLIGLAGWTSLDSLTLNSDPQSLAAGLPALKVGEQAQSVLGASGELDVYVRGTNVLSPAFLDWDERAQAAVLAQHGGELQPIVSPAGLLSWLGPNPTQAQINSAMTLLPAYLTTVAVRDDQAQTVLAFGVKLGSLESEAKLISSVRSELPPLPPGATVAITGLPAVAAHSNQLLSSNRLLPNLVGIAAFGAVLALVLGRRRDALLAVASAALATGWGFAVLWATGTSLTPLTISLGSLTSAVGGEFAVMALGRYAAGERRPWSAVVIAAATSVTGFAVLAISRLDLLRQFGLVLAGSVALALLSAWLIVSLSRVLLPSPVPPPDHPGRSVPDQGPERPSPAVV